MFIAMNRFKIRLGQEEAFEALWRDRDSHLKDLPGFKTFHLLKGPATEEYTLYASHTVWASKAHFEDWTRSEAFRLAHKNAGSHGDLYIGHPNFEGFEMVAETALAADAEPRSL